jgi:hypothetical protein
MKLQSLRPSLGCEVAAGVLVGRYLLADLLLLAATALTPLQRGPVLGLGLLMDRFATSECLEQPALCRMRADERLRAVWISMALIWRGLALKERLQRLNA